MTAIADIHAREILDSRGNPTVEVEVTLDSGAIGRAAVPSGASTGAHEAVEKRDGGPALWRARRAQGGRARSTARFSTRCRASTPADQLAIDRTLIELDGTPNKGRLGANAVLGVSLACAKASAIELDLPLYRYVGGVFARTLPVPMMNIVNGGVHADNPIDIQEFMIMPVGAAERRRGDPRRLGDLPRAAPQAARCRAQHQCRRRGRVRAEPRLGRRRARLCDAGDRGGRLQPGEDVVLALDPASTEFYRDGKYDLEGEGKVLDAAGMVAYYADLVAPLPDRLDRGRHGRGRLGGLGAI